MSDKPTVIELTTSKEVCAGAATAFVCRNIALRAGAYAPGIHEHVFRELERRELGSDVDGVARWFAASAPELHRLGYRLCGRRIAFRTPMIAGWVERGKGFRGAVLTTAGSILHDRLGEEVPHAVGLALEAPAGGDPPSLTLLDPYPGTTHRRIPDEALEPAHRLRKYAAMVIYWAGYS